jgi:hypothetical protein
VEALTPIQSGQQVQQDKDMLVVEALFMRQVVQLNQAVAGVARLLLVRLAHPAQAGMAVLALPHQYQDRQLRMLAVVELGQELQQAQVKAVVVMAVFTVLLVLLL